VVEYGSSQFKKNLFMIPGITDKTCKYIFGTTSYVILFIWRIALLWFPMFWRKVKPLVSTPFYRSCFYICLSLCVFLCCFLYIKWWILYNINCMTWIDAAWRIDIRSRHVWYMFSWRHNADSLQI